MKFYTYINENLSSSNISYENLIQILKKNCIKNLKYSMSAPLVYRAINSNNNYEFSDKNKRPIRKSINTSNHYNILFSEILESWKKYPKRNKSLICSLSENYVKNFADNAFIVIPFDNCNIGICPKNDFWRSFYNNLKNIDIISLEIFNDVYFKELNIKDDKTSIIKFLDVNIDYFSDEYGFSLLRYNAQKDNIDTSKTTVYKYFNDIILNPVKNDFKLIKSLNDISYNMKDNELWFDGSAVLININKKHQLEDIYSLLL